MATRRWHKDPLLWTLAAGAALSYFTSKQYRLARAASKCEPIDGISDWFVDTELRPDTKRAIATAMDAVIPESEEWTSFELAQQALARVSGSECSFRDLFDNATDEGQVALMSIVRLADERLDAAGF